MPIVMIQVDASNTTGPSITAATGELGKLSKALDVAAGSADAAGKQLDTVGPKAAAQASGLDTMSVAAKGLNSGLRGTNTAVDSYIRAMEKLDNASAKGKLGFDAIKAGTVTMNTSLANSMLVIDAFILKLQQMDAAALVSRGALASIGRLSGAGLGSGGGSGGSGGYSAGNYYGTSAARLGDFGLYGNKAVSFGGNRLGSGVLGGVPMPALIGGVAAVAAGVYATVEASKFWSAIAQTAAQAGLPVGPGSNAFGKSVLNYGASGKDPYRVAVEAQGVEPLLARGISMKAVSQALPSIAQISAQNQAPDLVNAVKLIGTLSAGTPGGKITGAQLTHYADWASKLETMTSILPGLITTSVPTMLGNVANTGVSASEAAGMLVKVGMQNPSARLDATSISRMVQDIALKPSIGAQKTANQLGVGIGPGAIEAYGGIYNYLGALHSALSADKNGPQDAAKIFNQTNALRAYNIINQGGGLAQTAGYTQQLGNVDGSANNAFNQYSQGTQQQGAQLMNRLNADFTSMGTVLQSTVLPQLINFGNALLKSAERLPGFVNPSASNKDKSTGFFPSVGHAFDVGMATLGFGDSTGTGLRAFWDSGPAKTKTVPFGSVSNTPFNGAGSAMWATSSGGSPMVNATYYAPPGYGPGAVQPYRPKYAGQTPMTHVMEESGYDNIQAFLAKSNKPPLESVHKTIQDDRATINALISLGANAGQVSHALAKLKTDLGRPGSGYSAQSTSNMSGLESAKVKDYITSIKANVLGGKIGADQDNLAVAQALGQSAAQLKVIFDQYINDQRALIMLEKPGLQRTLQLNSLNKQGIIGDAGYATQGRNRAIQDAQNQASIDKNNGNFGAYVKDLKNVFALQSRQPGQNASDIALLKSNMLLAIGALNPKQNIHPFYQQNPGVGGLIAGINSTAVRVGGGKDPQSEAIHELTKELAAANARYENLLREIADNTRGNRPAANKPPSFMQGQRSASS